MMLRPAGGGEPPGISDDCGIIDIQHSKWACPAIAGVFTAVVPHDRG
jgi:hypothetical protein